MQVQLGLTRQHGTSSEPKRGSPSMEQILTLRPRYRNLVERESATTRDATSGRKSSPESNISGMSIAGSWASFVTEQACPHLEAWFEVTVKKLDTPPAALCLRAWGRPLHWAL